MVSSATALTNCIAAVVTRLEDNLDVIGDVTSITIKQERPAIISEELSDLPVGYVVLDNKAGVKTNVSMSAGEIAHHSFNINIYLYYRLVYDANDETAVNNIMTYRMNCEDLFKGSGSKIATGYVHAMSGKQTVRAQGEVIMHTIEETLRVKMYD